MAFSRVLAYHLTFTTYGTRLHGDQRGTIFRGRAGQPPRLMPPSSLLREAMSERMRFAPVLLTAPMRKTVREAIEDYCKFKSWTLLALHVRTNHVHCALVASDSSSKMLQALKARATRVLRHAGLVAPDRPVWGERGSQRKLYTQAAIDRVARYVDLSQGNPLDEA